MDPLPANPACEASTENGPLPDGPRYGSELELGIQGEPNKNRPQSNRRPPVRLQDYVCHAITHPFSPPLRESSLGTTYPLSHFINYKHFSSSHRAFLASITSHFEPQYFSQAIHDPKWLEAMEKEINALEENQT